MKQYGLENLEINKKKLKEIIRNYETVKSGTQLQNGNLPVKDCCSIGKKRKLCMCSKTIYQIRPYVFEILRALQPFFEIIALSNMPNYELEQIIDHIEVVLNKPIIEMINRQARQKKELKQVWGQKENTNPNDEKQKTYKTIRNKSLLPIHSQQFKLSVY